MATENWFTHVVFTDYILPWILVFVLVFAILEKSKLLGEGKRQINAIIGLIFAFILLAFPASRDLIVALIPILVIIMVILFVFLFLYSFASGETKGDPLGKKVKVGIGILIALALVIIVLVITGTWDMVWSVLTTSTTGANILFIIIALAAVAAVLFGHKGKKEE